MVVTLHTNTLEPYMQHPYSWKCILYTDMKQHPINGVLLRVNIEMAFPGIGISITVYSVYFAGMVP